MEPTITTVKLNYRFTLPIKPLSFSKHLDIAAPKAPCVRAHGLYVSVSIFTPSLFNCSLALSVHAQRKSQSHQLKREVSFDHSLTCKRWPLRRAVAYLILTDKHLDSKSSAAPEEPFYGLTCMTALNQHVFPMFFIPTGQSPTLLQSFCLWFSPQTSQRFLLERLLFSAVCASWGLSQKMHTVL